MSKKGGPVTERGKRIASLNAARHCFRQVGIRPCAQGCPLWNTCEERAIGEPCPVEAKEFAGFVARLTETFGLVDDVAGQAHAEVLALQMVRIRRGNLYLSTLEHGGWADKSKEYLLKELRNLEVAFTQGLAQLRKHRAASTSAQVMELRILDPVEDPDGDADPT